VLTARNLCQMDTVNQEKAFFFFPESAALPWMIQRVRARTSEAKSRQQSRVRFKQISFASVCTLL